MGGLGDLAVVDLLEGVEALAGGRQGVHQMHGGGGIVGLEYLVSIRLFVGDVIVGSRAIFLSHKPGARLAQKKRLARRSSAKIMEGLRLHFLDSYAICRRRHWEQHLR